MKSMDLDTMVLWLETVTGPAPGGRPPGREICLEHLRGHCRNSLLLSCVVLASQRRHAVMLQDIST